MSGDLLKQVHRFTMEDDGREAVIAAGERIEIALPEIAGTAFEWGGPIPAPLILEQDGFTPGGAPGGAGLRRLIYRAIAPGDAEIELRRHRPWEPVESADARFTLRVEVR